MPGLAAPSRSNVGDETFTRRPPAYSAAKSLVSGTKPHPSSFVGPFYYTCPLLVRLDFFCGVAYTLRHILANYQNPLRRVNDRHVVEAYNSHWFIFVVADE